MTNSRRAETKPSQLHPHTSKHQAALEDQRARIAREIHDQLGQSLTALKLDLALLMKDERGCDAKLSALMTNVEGIIRTMKEVVSGLRPRILEDFGLITAIECELEKFSERTGMRCTYSTSEKELDFNREQSIGLFRILQEALTNVACHAQASTVTVTVTVTLKRDDDSAVMEILDDGVGIPRSKACDRLSLGLLNMRERARELSGEARVTRRSGGGTHVSVRIPITHRDAEPFIERRGGTERRTTQARTTGNAHPSPETEPAISDVMSAPGNGR